MDASQGRSASVSDQTILCHKRKKKKKLFCSKCQSSALSNKCLWEQEIDLEPGPLLTDAGHLLCAQHSAKHFEYMYIWEWNESVPHETYIQERGS